MKLIKCIIQPHKIDEVLQGLQNIVTGMTVSEFRGFGHQKGQLLLYRRREYGVSLLPKAIIEIGTDVNKNDDVVRRESENARNGQIGDGRILVLPTEENYHVRTW